MKHDWYVHLTGYAIDSYVTTHRCKNCDISTGIASWLWDQECPNTGAPDWGTIDAAERKAGMARMLERMREEKKEPAP